MIYKYNSRLKINDITFNIHTAVNKNVLETIRQHVELTQQLHQIRLHYQIIHHNEVGRVVEADQYNQVCDAVATGRLVVEWELQCCY